MYLLFLLSSAMVECTYAHERGYIQIRNKSESESVIHIIIQSFSSFVCFAAALIPISSNVLYFTRLPFPLLCACDISLPAPASSTSTAGFRPEMESEDPDPSSCRRGEEEAAPGSTRE